MEDRIDGKTARPNFIYKHYLIPEGYPNVILGHIDKVLAVQEQNGNVYCWTLEDPQSPMMENGVIIRLFGTG